MTLAAVSADCTAARPLVRESSKASRRAASVLRRWAADPLRLGTVVPSSHALGRQLALHAWPAPRKAVLELGSGRGVIAQALREAGLGPNKLVMMEADPARVQTLRAAFDGYSVIEGDARHLPDLLPERWRGRIGSVICAIPLAALSRADQRRLVQAMLAVAPGYGFLHASACATSPLPAMALGLHAERIAWMPLSVPPTSIWHYRPAD